MHFADIITSGRKYSSILNRRPTSAMPVAIGPAIRGAGGDLGLERRVDEADGVLVLAVDDVPLDLVEQLLDLLRCVGPPVGLEGVLHVVLQVLDIEILIGINDERHVAVLILLMVRRRSGPGEPGCRDVSRASAIDGLRLRRRLRRFFRSPVQGS